MSVTEKKILAAEISIRQHWVTYNSVDNYLSALQDGASESIQYAINGPALQKQLPQIMELIESCSNDNLRSVIGQNEIIEIEGFLKFHFTEAQKIEPEKFNLFKGVTYQYYL